MPVISPQLSALLDHAITQGPGRSDELIGQIADALTQLRAEDEFRTACRTILDTLAASNPAPTHSKLHWNEVDRWAENKQDLLNALDVHTQCSDAQHEWAVEEMTRWTPSA